MSSATIHFNQQDLIIDSWPDNITDLLKLRQELGFNQASNTDLLKAINHQKPHLNHWHFWMLALLISAPYLQKHEANYPDLKYINYHLTDYLTYLALYRKKPEVFYLNTISNLTNFFIDHELKTIAAPLVKIIPHEQKQSWLADISDQWTDRVKDYPLSMHNTYHWHHYNRTYMRERRLHIKKHTKRGKRGRIYHYQDVYYKAPDSYHDTLTRAKHDQHANKEYWMQLNREQNFYLASQVELMTPQQLTDYIDNHYSNLPDCSLDDQIIIKERCHEINQALQHYLKDDDRKHYIIDHRLGFFDIEPESLEVVGQALSISRERVRQIQNHIIRILKHNYYLHDMFPEYSLTEIIKHAKQQNDIISYQHGSLGQNIDQFYPTTTPAPNPARHDYFFYLKGDFLTDRDYDYHQNHDMISLLKQLI